MIGEHMLIIFHGYAVAQLSLVENVKGRFPGEEILVVGYKYFLPNPALGLTSVAVEDFVPQEGVTYRVIENGSLTHILLTVIKRLISTKAEFTVWQLTSNRGQYQLW